LTLKLTITHIQQLPDSFVKLRSLVTCSIGGNQLSEFPVSTTGECYASLKELCLAENSFTTWPKAFGSMIVDATPELHIIDLSNNAIEVLEDRMEEFPKKLVRLNVSNNQLRDLPVCLGGIETLTSITVDGNPLRAIFSHKLRVGGSSAILTLLRERWDEQQHNLLHKTA